MLLLAVDTSGRQGGITLARGSADEFEIIESAVIQGGTFSAELIPQISEVLACHRLSAQDVEAVVAVTGPGSFTGLRVGLTAVKGLAEALNLPIAAVSGLELLAFYAVTRVPFVGGPSAVPLPILALIDAGRNEVYAGIYEHGSPVRKREEMLLSFTEARELAGQGGFRAVASDPAIAAKFSHIETCPYPGSHTAAQLGLKKLLAGDTMGVLALDPNYIRKSEAEYLSKIRK
jgi:tRNA threonylcarbamoyladenosine biosynthesis protein TsaB